MKSMTVSLLSRLSGLSPQTIRNYADLGLIEVQEDVSNGYRYFSASSINQTYAVRRLSELGFLPGSEIACLLVSPLGDPRAYQICDTLIALRGRDARHIELDEFPEKGVNAP